MKLYHFLTPYTKINPKWIKDLYVRQESSTVLEENIGSNLFGISHSNFFQDMSPKAKETKVKMNFWDFIKIKSFPLLCRSWESKIRMLSCGLQTTDFSLCLHMAKGKVSSSGCFL